MTSYDNIDYVTMDISAGGYVIYTRKIELTEASAKSWSQLAKKSRLREEIFQGKGSV